MKQRLVICGMGRIGRCVLRAFIERAELRESIDIVGISDVAPMDAVAHLLKYDSSHGRLAVSMRQKADGFVFGIDGEYSLPYLVAGAILPKHDLLLDCTGRAATRALGLEHLAAGAAKVLFSQPGDAELDATCVYGLNHQILTGEEQLVSAGSCTTNALLPVLAILQDNFGIESGHTNTLHSAMNDQPVIDAYHDTDLRKTRAALNSIIPVDTALDKGIERILPALAGRFCSQAMRVPTLNVSAIDLTVLLSQAVTVEQIHQALAVSPLTQAEVLSLSAEPLASCDFNHHAASAIVDTTQTQVAGDRLAKLLIWFDNEWAYANRLLDLADCLTPS